MLSAWASSIPELFLLILLNEWRQSKRRPGFTWFCPLTFRLFGLVTQMGNDEINLMI